MSQMLALVILLLAVFCVPSAVSAEWFADLYLGAAFTQSEDVTATVPDLGIRVTEKGEPETSVSVGGRLGYWFDGFRWLGLALDASYFAPGEDLKVYPVSALVMARWPLLASRGKPWQAETSRWGASSPISAPDLGSSSRRASRTWKTSARG